MYPEHIQSGAHHQRVGLADVVGFLAGDQLDGFDTVSYTHLDVYKRQVVPRI